ncbi:MAG: alpha/beta hydrolase [Halovenus sp.]
MIGETFAKLPPELQDKALSKLMQSGLFSRVPGFAMLFETMEFIGGNGAELRAIFRQVDSLDESGIAAVRAFADDVRNEADLAASVSDDVVARRRYRESVVYYAVADWLTPDWEGAQENYDRMIPAFDRYRSLTNPHIENIELPYETGSLYAYFRLPESSDPPFPAVVIVQGNDSVKELMTPFERAAIDRGLATLTIDQAGWGESGLTGNRFNSLDDLGNSATIAADFLADDERIDVDRIGLFGISYGALLAPLSAGLEPRFSAVVGLGGPIFHPGRIEDIWNAVPELMVRRSYRFTGTQNREELINWTENIIDEVYDTLHSVTCPAKIVHDGSDQHVPLDDAHRLSREIGDNASMKIVPRGNHMCTDTLSRNVVPYMCNWLRKTL